MTDAPAPAWPDESKPGVPLEPERTGPHWIEDKSLNHVVAVTWCHVMEQYHDMAQTIEPRGAAKWWRYLGPCHTPAEVAALVAQVRREAIEEAARVAKRVQEQALECSREPGLIAVIRREFQAQARGAKDAHDAILALAVKP